ncbi:MAG: aldo/keto reductase [Dehalococcoidia bacterium]|nr:aldo/keto reductase [Dehalococcoidia bacterium]MSQ17915.1 aldo/keto reductase [Dehalococcoidia bacterium]
MELKELGGTGVMVPEIGLGTWKYSGGTAPLRRGLELGAFLIDTAEIYRTEAAVGQAIKGIRDQVFIATKVSGGHLRRDQLIRAAVASLGQLGVKQIDLYQIHWPDSNVPIKETMGAIESLVDRGVVRYIGVSNFSVRELAEAQAALRNHPIVSNQVLYNLRWREIEDDLLPYCLEQQITVMAYTPLNDGELAGSAGRGRRKGNAPSKDQGLQVLAEIAAETGKTQAQVALNWCTAHPSVIAIPKSDSVARTEENCGASGWRLTPEQMGRLDAAFTAP